MKNRNGFVSNSSSSSFIVIDAKSGYETPDWEEKLVVNGEFGECFFGWEPKNYRDIGSRIIFAYIQAKYLDSHYKKTKYLSMLEDVIKKNTGVKTIEWDLYEDYYIDHQSSAEECANIDMFDSKKKMKDFIFGRGSYIHTDNDNY